MENSKNKNFINYYKIIDESLNPWSSNEEINDKYNKRISYNNNLLQNPNYKNDDIEIDNISLNNAYKILTNSFEKKNYDKKLIEYIKKQKQNFIKKTKPEKIINLVTEINDIYFETNELIGNKKKIDNLNREEFLEIFNDYVSNFENKIKLIMKELNLVYISKEIGSFIDEQVEIEKREIDDSLKFTKINKINSNKTYLWFDQFIRKTFVDTIGPEDNKLIKKRK